MLNKKLTKLNHILQIMKTVSDQEKSFVLPVKFTNVRKSYKFHWSFIFLSKWNICSMKQVSRCWSCIQGRIILPPHLWSCSIYTTGILHFPESIFNGFTYSNVPLNTSNSVIIGMFEYENSVVFFATCYFHQTLDKFLSQYLYHFLLGS